jgi:hypothetical protein
MSDLKETQINDTEFVKFLQDNKDKETSIEIRLIDAKHNKIARKMLTVKELVILEAGGNIEWHNLPGKKNENE